MNQNTKAKYLLESFLSEAKKVAGDVEPKDVGGQTP